MTKAGRLLALRSVAIQSGYHSRGYLPHIKVEGAAYFVTFRLADSLPRAAIARLREAREDLLRRAAVGSGVPDASVSRALFDWHSEQVDSLLDQSVGESWLRQPRVAELVAGALRHFEAQRYQLYAWVVMPNHVHAVVRPSVHQALDSILHTWKSFTAHEAGKLLRLGGSAFWQRESYDHWIRNGADLAHCCHYTENNPVKAGLCHRPEEWLWSSATERTPTRPKSA